MLPFNYCNERCFFWVSLKIDFSLSCFTRKIIFNMFFSVIFPILLPTMYIGKEEGGRLFRSMS